MFQAFWLRTLLAAIKQGTGVEKLPQRAKEWPDFFDNTDGIGPIKRTLFYKSKGGVMLPYKGRPRPVPASTKVGIEAHITAVEFGTTKRSRKFWLGAIDRGELDVHDNETDQDVSLWRKYGETPQEAAERMALHQRFWNVPYHWLALQNGDILHNNDITRYTYHGNGGNELLVGVSLEGNYPGIEANRKSKHSAIDEHVIETARGALRLAVKHSRDLGSPIEWLYAHRQYSKGRLGDPGEWWWRNIGLVVALEMNLKVNYPFKHGSGNPIPHEWDDNGIVDFRGRPIRAA